MGMAVGGAKARPSRHQHDSDDRRVAGVDHHLHGDHASHAEGPGGAGAAAARHRISSRAMPISVPW